MAQFPAEAGQDGSFERQQDAFREPIAPGGKFEPEPARYQLYISKACPWAHRSWIVLRQMGLEHAVGVSVADPVRDERGWAFREGPGHGPDEAEGFGFLAEAYRATDPGFAARVTVPALWDKLTRRVVNNSEDDLCRIWCRAFRDLARHPVDLFPDDLAEEQDKLSDFIYETINNGVYRAGFAAKQQPYETAVAILFDALDRLERRLAEGGPFLFGGRIVETDWRLFCTLIRFDAVYHGHFKCNLRRIIDYPALQTFMERLYHQPGIAETVDFDHIKRHYYVTHDDLNPTRIVPRGPAVIVRPPSG